MRHFGGTSELHVLLTGFVVNDMLLLVLILEKKKNKLIMLDHTIGFALGKKRKK
jgi:hypothetical protein